MARICPLLTKMDCLRNKGELLSQSPFPACSLEGFTDSPDLSGIEKNDLVDFVGSMLRLSPEERPSAKEMLGHEWLQEVSK